jgi:transcriptional regulator with XRE-family HTH domain
VKNITDIPERIKQLIDSAGVNPNEFAKKLGYNRSQAVYDMLNGKAKPSFDFFEKLLHSEYSVNLNLKWLILGEGEMVKKKAQGSDFMVMEANSPYGNKCPFCVEKDKQIHLLEKLNRSLEVQLERYDKGCHPNENTQKTG